MEIQGYNAIFLKYWKLKVFWCVFVRPGAFEDNYNDADRPFQHRWIGQELELIEFANGADKTAIQYDREYAGIQCEKKNQHRRAVGNVFKRRKKEKPFWRGRGCVEVSGFL